SSELPTTSMCLRRAAPFSLARASENSSALRRWVFLARSSARPAGVSTDTAKRTPPARRSNAARPTLEAEEDEWNELICREQRHEHHHDHAHGHSPHVGRPLEEVLFAARFVEQIHHEQRRAEQREEPQREAVLRYPHPRAKPAQECDRVGEARRPEEHP